MMKFVIIDNKIITMIYLMYIKIVDVEFNSMNKLLIDVQLLSTFVIDIYNCLQSRYLRDIYCQLNV